jgi:hypothetical protein
MARSLAMSSASRRPQAGPFRVRDQAGEKVEWRTLPVAELAMGLALTVISIKMSVGEQYSLGRAAILFAVCGLIVAYGFFRNPFTPFYVYAFVSPIYTAFGTSFALILGGTALVLLHRKKLQWEWAFSWVGVAFCLWTIASLVWAEAHCFGQDGFVAQALPPMVLAVIISGVGDPRFRRNLILLVVGACVAGSLGSLRNWSKGAVEFGGGMRVYSLIRPDVFSAWELFGLMGALAWLLAGRPAAWLRWILYSSLPVIVMGIGLCGYRAAILAAGLGVVAVSICQRRLCQGLAVVSAVLGAAAILYLVQPEMFAPVLARFETIQHDRGSERLDVWQGGLRVLGESPLIGVGCDNFKFAVSQHYGAEFMAHSIYIGTLVELGIVGFALMLCWFAVLLRKAWRSESRLWVFPLLIAYLFQAAFLHEFYFSCFWLALGLAEGARPGVRRSLLPVGARASSDVMQRLSVFPRQRPFTYALAKLRGGITNRGIPGC